jgi:hypothetical protein
MENLEDKFEGNGRDPLGEMEVVTVRAPSGKYRQYVWLRGTMSVTQAEVEEAQRESIKKYEFEMSTLKDPDRTVNRVTYYVQKGHAGEIKRTIYPTIEIKAEEISAQEIGPYWPASRKILTG